MRTLYVQYDNNIDAPPVVLCIAPLTHSRNHSKNQGITDSKVTHLTSIGRTYYRTVLVFQPIKGSGRQPYYYVQEGHRVNVAS
jgi:hypothetical protein